MTREIKEYYYSKLLDYQQWKLKGEQLIAAAELLEPKIQEYFIDLSDWANKKKAYPVMDDRYNSTYFMLMSFAIENLLKAMLVKYKYSDIDTEFKKTSRLPNILKSHDLFDLSLKAGLEEFALENEDYLKRLTRSSIWYGRYPISIDPNSMEVVVYSEYQDEPILLSSYSSMDSKWIKRIIDDLMGRLSA